MSFYSVINNLSYCTIIYFRLFYYCCCCRCVCIHYTARQKIMLEDCRFEQVFDNINSFDSILRTCNSSRDLHTKIQWLWFCIWKTFENKMGKKMFLNFSEKYIFLYAGCYVTMMIIVSIRNPYKWNCILYFLCVFYCCKWVPILCSHRSQLSNSKFNILCYTVKVFSIIPNFLDLCSFKRL